MITLIGSSDWLVHARWFLDLRGLRHSKLGLGSVSAHVLEKTLIRTTRYRSRGPRKPPGVITISIGQIGVMTEMTRTKADANRTWECHVTGMAQDAEYSRSGDQKLTNGESGRSRSAWVFDSISQSNSCDSPTLEFRFTESNQARRCAIVYGQDDVSSS